MGERDGDLRLHLDLQNNSKQDTREWESGMENCGSILTC